MTDARALAIAYLQQQRLLGGEEVILAQPTTTPTQMPITGLLESAGPPKNPSSTAIPLARESFDSPDACRRDSARAATRPLTPRKVKPRAPAMKWIMPRVLIEVGIPSGVPGGKPSIGSALKAAATTMLRPKRPSSQLVALWGWSTLASPIAAAITITPVTMKVAVCIHPLWPFASTLSGCRAKSKPSLTNPCMMPAAR